MRRIYIGIDEVGRGAWAGPLVLAALCFSKNISIPDTVHIRDSKALSRAQRASSEVFLRKNSTFSIQRVPVETIDEIGIQAATIKGLVAVCHKISRKIMRESDIESATFKNKYRFLIDGRSVCNPDLPHEFIVGGDDKIPVISAASIIAKTYRDRFMLRAAKKYPRYGFESHVGYGTQEHREALTEYGICDIHRKSYAPVKLYTCK